MVLPAFFFEEQMNQIDELRRDVRIVGFEVRNIPKDPAKPNLGTKPVEYVITAPRDGGKYTQTPHRIADVQRSTNGLWEVIEPFYDKWKAGQEMPETGTPLTSWNGVNNHQVEMLRSHSIRTVEDLANVTDGNLTKMEPGTRFLRDAARQWVKDADKRDVATALAEKDVKIEAMQARLEELTTLIGRDNAEEPIKRKPGRPKRDEAEAA